MDRRELARRLAEVQQKYVSEIFPNGAVPSIAMYGQFAADTWQAFSQIDLELDQAMSRRDAEPVDVFVVSRSTDLNVYVATRQWILDAELGKTDLFVYSTGPAVARVFSGKPKHLVNNPYLDHIKNLSAELRGHLGYGGRQGDDVPTHHFHPDDAAGSTELPQEWRDAIVKALNDLRRHRP